MKIFRNFKQVIFATDYISTLPEDVKVDLIQGYEYFYVEHATFLKFGKILFSGYPHELKSILCLL